jgi:2-polyprenyl-3-methyl-5-hydroxy-6-metoxy-1,4-benzoquinol methylase
MAAYAWNNRNHVELRKCSVCRFVFSSEAEVAYDEFFVDRFVGASHSELMQAARAERLDKLALEIAEKSGLSDGAHVLDFGSGVGLAALSFMEVGFDVTAVEESKKYVAGHKSLGLRSFPSIDQARQYSDTFDLVVMKDVLEHVSAPRQVLESVVNCVRPGGYFYIRVPNTHAYKFVPSVDTRSHVNHFTPKTLTKLLAHSELYKVDFIGVYDVSSRVGRLYHALFWPPRKILPLYHQISLLFQRQPLKNRR